jgi:dTMP kinase
LKRFISFEGPDGCGKSTQIRLLAQHLRAAEHDVLLSREPGGTPIGDQVRKVLFDLGNTEMDPRTEILLFSASRAQLVHQIILPHLEQGWIVLSDRFADSTLAYQGYGHGLDRDALRAITHFATSGLKPGLTLLLDLPVEEGLRRRERDGNWNRLDAYELEFHRRVRRGYHALAQECPERWVVIDAMRTKEEVQAEIIRVVDQRLETRD